MRSSANLMGGRWQEGSKATYPFVSQAFASRGYVMPLPG
jgi:hypothetical protein